MTNRDRARRWQDLSRLLEPIHESAAATARNLCRSSDEGDDLYQETVLRVFEKLHTLREESRFRSWFFAVLLSVHRSRHRRGFWRRFLPLENIAPDEPGLVGKNGHQHEEEFLAARRVARALSRLPAEQREAVVLYELEGFSMEEVAEMQDATVAAVKSRVLRGRERLRRYYRSQSVQVVRGSHPAATRETAGAKPATNRSIFGSADALAPAYSSASNRKSTRGGES